MEQRVEHKSPAITNSREAWLLEIGKEIVEPLETLTKTPTARELSSREPHEFSIPVIANNIALDCIVALRAIDQYFRFKFPPLERGVISEADLQILTAYFVPDSLEIRSADPREAGFTITEDGYRWHTRLRPIIEETKGLGHDRLAQVESQLPFKTPSVLAVAVYAAISLCLDPESSPFHQAYARGREKGLVLATYRGQGLVVKQNEAFDGAGFVAFAGVLV